MITDQVPVVEEPAAPDVLAEGEVETDIEVPAEVYMVLLTATLQQLGIERIAIRGESFVRCQMVVDFNPNGGATITMIPETTAHAGSDA